MAVINQLEELGFEPYSGFYLLKADSEIYHFIQDGLTTLMEYGELFYSDAFRKMKAKQSNSFSVGLRVSKDIDLLELELNYGDITKEELQHLFRSYRLKRKFFRLTDGSFIDLESEEIGKMVDILDNLNVSAKEMEGQTTFHLSKGLALYVDDLFDETAVEVQKNEECHQLIDTISNMEQQNCRTALMQSFARTRKLDING